MREKMIKMMRGKEGKEEKKKGEKGGKEDGIKSPLEACMRRGEMDKMHGIMGGD